MKHQKSPVLLGSILVVAFGGLAIYGLNLPKPEGGGHQHDEKPPQQQQQAAPEKSAVTSDARPTMPAKAMHQQMTDSKGRSRLPDTEDVAERDAEPSILLPDSTIYKPTPNTAGIAAHWYDEESSYKDKK